MSSIGLQPIAAKPESITEKVFEAIRDAIVSKTLEPGSRISEARLAAQLQVSKTPVREVLLRLRQSGLVEPIGRSLRVVKPSAGAIRDAYELRAGLERTAIGYAASRASTAERDDIVVAAEASLASARVGDSMGFQRHDMDFHMAIARAGQNLLLTRAVNDALVLTSALRRRDVPASGDSVVCAQEHLQVAEAVRTGDARGAAEALFEHIHHVMTLVLRESPSRV
ncbi:GntR family transcriptional regulator [Streptomyces sp. NPDC000880]